MVDAWACAHDCGFWHVDFTVVALHEAHLLCHGLVLRHRLGARAFSRRDLRLISKGVHGALRVHGRASIKASRGRRPHLLAAGHRAAVRVVAVRREHLHSLGIGEEPLARGHGDESEHGVCGRPRTTESVIASNRTLWTISTIFGRFRRAS